jgi:hypothetical protein
MAPSDRLGRRHLARIHPCRNWAMARLVPWWPTKNYFSGPAPNRTEGHPPFWRPASI